MSEYSDDWRAAWLRLRAAIDAEAVRETRLTAEQVRYVLALMDSLEAQGAQRAVSAVK
jgi:hypothetical protein